MHHLIILYLIQPRMPQRPPVCFWVAPMMTAVIGSAENSRKWPIIDWLKMGQSIISFPLE